MPDRAREVQFLRQQAARLQAMAEQHQTQLSPSLRRMAQDLEARANELEKAGWGRAGAGSNG